MSVELTNETFEQQVIGAEPGKLVVVDFWAPWCAPCRAFAPTFEAVAAEYGERVSFFKVNIDETDIAVNYSVRSIPTLMLFRDGKPIATQSGNVPKSKLVEMVNAQVNS